MRGNFQVRFLGEGKAVMSFSYPTLPQNEGCPRMHYNKNLLTLKTYQYLALKKYRFHILGTGTEKKQTTH